MVLSSNRTMTRHACCSEKWFRSARFFPEEYQRHRLRNRSCPRCASTPTKPDKTRRRSRKLVGLGTGRDGSYLMQGRHRVFCHVGLELQCPLPRRVLRQHTLLRLSTDSANLGLIHPLQILHHLVV